MGLLGILLGTLSPAWPQEAEASGPENDWRSLVFEASKWSISARFEVERARIAPNRWRLRLDSTYIGRFSSSETVFDERGALTSSISWRRSGKSSYWNERHYLSEHIERVRRTPATSAEVSAPPQTWSQVVHREDPYPQGRERCAVVADPAALLHLLSAMERLPVDLCFLSGKMFFTIETYKHPEPVELMLEVQDARTRPPATGAGKKQVLAWRIDLRPQPLVDEDPQSAQKSFDLFGLERDLSIYIGCEDHIPVRITGRTRLLGRLNIDLSEIKP